MRGGLSDEVSLQASPLDSDFVTNPPLKHLLSRQEHIFSIKKWRALGCHNLSLPKLVSGDGSVRLCLYHSARFIFNLKMCVLDGGNDSSALCLIIGRLASFFIDGRALTRG